MRKDEEIDLVRLAQAGDDEARNTLVLTHKGLLYRWVFKYIRGARSCDVEDLYGVAVLGMIKAISLFDPDYGTRLSTYAYRPVTQALDYYLKQEDSIVRQPLKKRRLSTTEIIDLGSVVEHRQTPESEDAIKQSLKHCTTFERNLLIDHYVKGLSYREIGIGMGVSRQRVEQIIKQAILKIRRKHEVSYEEGRG